MPTFTQHCRVTAPMGFPLDGRAVERRVPAGPALLEHLPGGWVDLIWGSAGQHSLKVPLASVEEAEMAGDFHLIHEASPRTAYASEKPVRSASGHRKRSAQPEEDEFEEETAEMAAQTPSDREEQNQPAA